SAGIDRLRSLIPKALDTLAAELEMQDGPNRLKAACAILRLAPLSESPLKIGPTEPDEIIRRIVLARRHEAQGPIEDIVGNSKGLPPFARQVEETWQELEARAAEADEPAP